VNGSAQIQPPPVAGQDDALAGLRGVLRVTRRDADVDLIRRAYEVAAFWHRGQTRLSGDPYITHPLAVATILAELGADDQMLCAALLHDTTGDTPCTVAALSREFGAEVAALVAGTAALDQIKGQGRKVARGLADARSADSRVLAIKVADRLHNMRTVEFIAHAKQLRKSRESLDFFAPVASRLSMDTIGTELEALAYATLKRNRHVRSVSGRLLVMMTALLPAGSRTRWCEEWLGELHTLPARRDRISFALHAVLGIPRLAVLARGPVPGQRRAG
jgi:(p)ppGpp synthase/HD superfamily hydrolase